jgi:carbonic anhydrase
VTSKAKIPPGERFPDAKPTFSGTFSYVTVERTIHMENGHETVTNVTMRIPWDHEHQVRLKIGKPGPDGKPVQTTYRVLQIHMHRHGEHTMDGGEYQLEMHCVLTDDSETATEPKAVLGFFIVQGEQNNNLNFYFGNLQHPDGKVELGSAQDLNQLLPHDKTYFSYNGSLTTPNLNDTPNPTPILWYVLRNEIHVSGEQYNKYFHTVEEHFRILQLNNTSDVWLIIPQPLGEK